MSMNSTKKTASSDFEKSLFELEKIVDRMEKGDQTLDETMKDFERGMILSEQCQKSLDTAQQKVEKLVKKHGSYELQSMEAEDDFDEVQEEGY